MANERKQRRGRRAHAWGDAVERSVEARLAEAGAEILARRRRTAAGEIDLAAMQGDVLMVAEVKARRTLAEALAAASPAKWARLGAAAECFAAEIGHQGDVRLDLIAVDRQGALAHIENASLAGAF